MPTSNEVDYKWYRYTADDASTWAVKIDKTWGDDTDSGFAAYNSTDPVLRISGGRAGHPRFLTMIDTATGRTKRLVVGSTTATAWTTANYSKALPVRGLGTNVTYALSSKTSEKLRRAGAIYNRPEVTVA